MYQLDHILVTLDLSDMDDFLIRYSNYLVENFNPKSITFMHVMNTYDIPKDVLKAFPDMDESLTDIVKEDLQEKVDEHFAYTKKVRTTVMVEEGLPTEHIVQFTKDNNISLTLMGKKVGYRGRGSIVRKVMNISPSSVLLISETTRPKIEHIMVRVDFTKISELALRMGLQIQQLTDAKLSCHHVYKLPIKYFAQATPENEKKMKFHMEKHSRKEYAKFMKKMKLDPEKIPCTYSFDKENDEAQVLYNHALNNGADLILIGSRLKSELGDVILDSTSEKLAGTEKNIPVLVVKDRKTSLGFLETLFD